MPAAARAQLNGMVVAGRVALVVGHPSLKGLTQVRCMVRKVNPSTQGLPERKRAVPVVGMAVVAPVHQVLVPWKQAS